VLSEQLDDLRQVRECHLDVGRACDPVEHVAASSYLRELAASDCSPATIRSYAFALLRWLRFLHEQLVGWERAERGDVRAFVEHLQETPDPQRRRRRPDAPPPRSVNHRAHVSERDAVGANSDSIRRARGDPAPAYGTVGQGPSVSPCARWASTLRGETVIVRAASGSLCGM
jgi:Phage integrase, N-terminal SAM-like domain